MQRIASLRGDRLTAGRTGREIHLPFRFPRAKYTLSAGRDRHARHRTAVHVPRMEPPALKGAAAVARDEREEVTLGQPRCGPVQDIELAARAGEEPQGAAPARTRRGVGNRSFFSEARTIVL